MRTLTAVVVGLSVATLMYLWALGSWGWDVAAMNDALVRNIEEFGVFGAVTGYSLVFFVAALVAYYLSGGHDA